jgi:UDP-glucose 4-epimerase
MASPVMPAKRVLIIGWGFIGAALGMKLHRAGTSVTGLTRTAAARTEAGIAAGIQIAIGNSSDISTLGPLIDRVDHVVYCAGGLPPPEAAHDPVRDASLMILPWLKTLEVVRARRRVGLTLVSSGGTIYGPATLSPHSETDRFEPISAYGVSRLACAAYARAYAFSDDVDVQVALCGNVYGPGQPHDRSQGVIAVFMHKMMKGLPITVFGNGRAVRDYVYIDDVTGALAAMVLRDLPVDTVNVGSGRGHTTLEVLEILSRVTGLRAIVEYAPARPHDVCWGARKVHRPDHQKCTGFEAHATIAPPPLSFCLAA